MKKTFLAFLVFTSVAQAASYPSICESSANNQNLVKAAQSGQYALTIESFKKAIQGSPIVLVGDEHFYTSIESMKGLIAYFSQTRGNKACIAFEFPKTNDDAQTSLNGILSNFDKIITDAPRQLAEPGHSAEELAEAKKNLQGIIKNRRNLSAYYGPLLTEARARGLNSKAVDDPRNGTEDLTLEQRNISIAQNIETLLRDKTCSSVLMFVGKAHLAESIYNKKSNRPESLAYFFNKFSKRYSATTINLQMTHETVPAAGKAWNQCTAPKLEKPIIFPSMVVIADDSSIMPADPSSPSMRDYDFTILLP